MHFRGQFQHAIDEKGRLAIPSRFRDSLKALSTGGLVLTHFDQCLLAYPMIEWEKLEVHISSLPQFDPKTIAFQRYFISGASECSLDKAGRVLIPAHLRSFGDLQKDCIMVGQLNRFEIWSGERWQKEFDRLTGQFGQMSQHMAELGTSCG